MNNEEIQKLRDLKDKAEKDVGVILLKLSEDTGHLVDGVSVEHIDVTVRGGPRRVIQGAVSITLTL